MKIWVAEDDSATRRMLEYALATQNDDVISVGDGNAAWACLTTPEAPRLAILDWMMPGMNGEEICRKMQQISRMDPVYIILLTGRINRQDVIAGLTAGANDYIWGATTWSLASCCSYGSGSPGYGIFCIFSLTGFSLADDFGDSLLHFLMG